MQLLFQAERTFCRLNKGRRHPTGGRGTKVTDGTRALVSVEAARVKKQPVPIFATRCSHGWKIYHKVESTEHNGGCHNGGSHIGQLPRQGVWELSFGVRGGGVLLLHVYNNNDNNDDDNDSTMTQTNALSRWAGRATKNFLKKEQQETRNASFGSANQKKKLWRQREKETGFVAHVNENKNLQTRRSVRKKITETQRRNKCKYFSTINHKANEQ